MDEKIFDDYSVEERELQAQEAQAERELEDKKLQDAFSEVLSTDAGLKAFKKVFDLCGYDAHLMRFNPSSGEINSAATNYNLSKRDVWLDLRTHIAPHHLSLIELPGE